MKSKFSFKKPKTWLIGAFIALLVILSCKKEFNTEGQPDRKQLSKLIQWYESNLKISDDNPFSKLEPNWDNLYIGNKDGKIVYEVELSNPDKLMLLGQKANRDNLSQELKKHSIKLLLFEGKKSHRILYTSYMSIESHNFEDMGALHYKNLKNFTGVVFFHHFNGILGNGWEYKDGKIDHKLNPLTSEEYEMFKRQIENGKQQDGYQCAMTTVEKYKYGCVGVGNQMNCGYLFVGYETVMRCSYIDDTTLRNEGDEGPNQGENNGGGGYEAPLIYDCADVLDGSAYIDPSCKTCIGGTTGLTGCPQKKIIDSLQGFPCAQAILVEIPSLQDTISKIMQSTFGGTTHNLIIKPKNAPGSNIDGWHTPKLTLTNGYNYSGGYSVTSTIEINEDVLNYATKEYILVTIYHEALHAFFTVEKNRLGNNFSNIYPDVNPFYINGPLGQIDVTKAIFVSDHSVMATNFLAKLEKAISQYNPSLSASNSDVIKAISSAGIVNQTNSQKQLNSNERDTRVGSYKGKKC